MVRAGPPIWNQSCPDPLYCQTALRSGDRPYKASLLTADMAPGPPTGVRCGHLPLALGLLAAHMQATAGWTLTDHADRLDDRHHARRLDTGVELALDLSYQQLPEGRQRLLRLVALHPGPDLDAHAAALAVPNGRAVCEAFVAAMRRYGVPSEVLTDNGKQFTGRFTKPRPAEVLFRTGLPRARHHRSAEPAEVADHDRHSTVWRGLRAVLDRFDWRLAGYARNCAITPAA